MSAIFLSNRQMILILHCTVIRPRKVLKQAPHAHRSTRTVLLQLDFQVLHKNAPEKGKPHYCCLDARYRSTKSILLIIQQAKKGTPLAMEVSSTADEVFIAKCLISLMIPLLEYLIIKVNGEGKWLNKKPII